MTIPRLPGPLDFLTQGFGAGIQAYDQQRQQQYDQAQTGARLILGLIQAGRLDPSMLSDPGMQQTLATAKIPVPPATAVVPSSAAERERRIATTARGVAPGSTAEKLLFDIPGLGSQISEEELRQGLLAVKNKALEDPAMARIMAEVLPPGVAAGREQVASAAYDPGAYLDAAYRFVSQANGDPVKAKAFAQADPQYQELVTSGQLSDEYFARAARQWSMEDEKLRNDRLQALNRRAEIDAAYRNFQAQDRSFDTEVQRLLRIMDLNQPGVEDNAFINSAQKKLQANPNASLNQFERAAVEKLNAYRQASQDLDNLQNQRGQLRGQFIGTKSPPVPTGNVDPAKVQATKLGIQRGEITADDVRKSPALTPEEKAEILGETRGRSGSKAPAKPRDRF